MRTEPPVSEPSAKSQTPAAAAAADPLDEPPGMRPGARMLRRRAVMRVHAGDAVEEFVADGLAGDGRAGGEQLLAPTVQCAVAGVALASQSGLPPPARSPAMAYMSLTTALRPASGPLAAPLSGALRSCGTKKPLMLLPFCVPRYQSRIFSPLQQATPGLRQNLLEGALDVLDAVRSGRTDRDAPRST